MSIRQTLTEEVLNEYDVISKMTLGSEDYTKTVNGVNSMVDKLNDMRRIENDARKLDIEEDKLKLEQERLAFDSKSQKVGNIIKVALFGVCTAVTIWANIDSKRFEMGYTHTSSAGRETTKKLLNFMDKFKS